MAEREERLDRRMSIPELNRLLENAGTAFGRHNANGLVFSELKKRFQSSGIESLKDLPAAGRINPRKTSLQSINVILSLSLSHPDWGCVRLCQALKAQGITVSSPTVQKILIKHDMGKWNERLLKLEDKALTGEVELSDEQIALIEKANPCFRERFNESSKPAEVIAQDTLLVGRLKNGAKIYLQSVVDTYSSYAFGFLHSGKIPDCAVAILHNYVLPFYKEFDLRVKKIVTNNGREYCGTAKHHYELYLMLNEIEHIKNKLRDNKVNGFSERFKQIVFNEFFKKAFLNKSYDDIELLQRDFDQWLSYYNNKRGLQGYRNLGKAPSEINRLYFKEHL